MSNERTPYKGPQGQGQGQGQQKKGNLGQPQKPGTTGQTQRPGAGIGRENVNPNTKQPMGGQTKTGFGGQQQNKEPWKKTDKE